MDFIYDSFLGSASAISDRGIMIKCIRRVSDVIISFTLQTYAFFLFGFGFIYQMALFVYQNGEMIDACHLYWVFWGKNRELGRLADLLFRCATHVCRRFLTSLCRNIVKINLWNLT